MGLPFYYKKRHGERKTISEKETSRKREHYGLEKETLDKSIKHWKKSNVRKKVIRLNDSRFRKREKKVIRFSINIE